MHDTKTLRPCAALALGEAVGLLCPQFGAAWPIAAFAAVLSALLGPALTSAAWRLVVAACVGLALALRACETETDVLHRASERNGLRPFEACVDVCGTVRTTCDASGTVWASFPANIEGLDAKVLLAVPEGTAGPRVGERWRCAGWLSAGRNSRKRLFYVNGRGTWARRIRTGPLAQKLADARAALCRRAGIGLAHDRLAADLSRAILLGERSNIPPDVRRAFAGAGTLHVFAISGLHVGVIARIAIVMLCLCLMPVRYVVLPLVPLLAAYVWMIGAPPSAVRAAVMVCVYSAAHLFGRRPNGLAAWSVTFLAVHILAPRQLFNVGSALSFAVMLALILAGRLASAFESGTVRRLTLAFGAWAAGVPIAAHVFGHVTPGGLVANLALLPAACVSVGAGAVGIVASFVSPAVAAHVNNFAALVTRLMVGISEVVSRLPCADIETPPWSVVDSLRWYALVALTLWLVSSVHRRRAARL